MITVVVPFWNGHQTIYHLLDGLPPVVPVVIVDDQSDEPLQSDRPNVTVVHAERRGYFSGAVNLGAERCTGDFVVVNQDARLEGSAWLDLIAEKRDRYAVIGEGVFDHPAWSNGYVQGTWMFVRRDAWEAVGGFDRRRYPLWGATAEWQLRACRAGFEALPLREVPGLVHGSDTRRKVRLNYASGPRDVLLGESIAGALAQEPRKTSLFLRTPPLVSVVIPCFNYGRYLPDAINSLVGGETCLGEMEQQTLPSFEVVIVDDASTDETEEIGRALADPWRGIRYLRHDENQGCPAALNTGVRSSHGRYVQVLSADDMLESDTLEVHQRVCETNPHRFAFGDLMIVKNGERFLHFPLPEYDFDRVLKRNAVSAGIMYPREAWRDAGGYPDEMRYGREDWAFNVALGRAGWCGVHAHHAGYLVRREGQNRSLRTGNVHKGEDAPPWDGRDWRLQFQRQMHSLYPRLYAGERPMGCCGGARRRPSRSTRNTAPVVLPGEEGMAVLEYVGGNDGTVAYRGSVTGDRYEFSNSKAVKYVDSRDAAGLVALRENNRPLFRMVKESPPPEPPPEAVAAAAGVA